MAAAQRSKTLSLGYGKPHKPDLMPCCHAVLDKRDGGGGSRCSAAQVVAVSVRGCMSPWDCVLPRS